jgi:hypothetical protein
MASAIFNPLLFPRGEHVVSLIWYSNRGEKLCAKSRRCSKIDRHNGKCDTKREYHSFWKRSVPYVKHSLKREFDELKEKMEDEHEAKLARVGEDREQELIVCEAEILQLKDASGEYIYIVYIYIHVCVCTHDYLYTISSMDTLIYTTFLFLFFVTG